MEKIEIPELEKIAEHGDESQKIRNFLAWLEGKKEFSIGTCIETECEYCGEDIYGFNPRTESIEKLLAEYFEIDLNKAEAERQLLLKQLQKQNNKD